MVFEKLRAAVKKHADAYNLAGVKRANDRVLADPRLQPARELAKSLTRARDAIPEDRREIAQAYLEGISTAESVLQHPTLDFGLHHEGREYLLGLASQVNPERYDEALRTLETNPSAGAVYAWKIDRIARLYAMQRVR